MEITLKQREIFDFHIAYSCFLWRMAKGKHKDYETIKLLIQGGQIETFMQLFNHIAPSVVYKDIGVNYNRFKRMLNHPDEFTMKELITLSTNIDCDAKIIIDLAYSQYLSNKATRKKGAK